MNRMLNGREFRASLGIGVVFATRIFGLMAILPVLAFAQADYQGATPILLSIAFGIYGLAQGCLQIPLGVLSDQYGRKVVIISGLAVMVLGSLVAAYSSSIWGLILGRLLQGLGAIGSTCIALLADVTRPRVRSISMAIVGSIIGLSFLLSIGLGSWLNNHIGLHGIFKLSALLPFFGMTVVYFMHYEPHVPAPSTLRWWEKVKAVCADKSLGRLNYSIASLHAIFSGIMLFVPLLILQSLGVEQALQWQVLMPMIALGFLVALPFLSFSEKTGQVRLLFMGSVLLIWLAITMMIFDGQMRIWCALFFFFLGFSCLEAKIPSLITQYAPIVHRGAASGVYSSCQYFGIFFGSTLSGFAYSLYGLSGVLFFNIILVFFWFIVLFSMKLPTITQKQYELHDLTQAQVAHLKNKLEHMAGVRGVYLDLQEKQILVSFVQGEAKKGELDIAVEIFIAFEKDDLAKQPAQKT
jgi:MFS family permease